MGRLTILLFAVLSVTAILAVTGVHPSEFFSQEQFDDDYDDDNSDAPQSLEDRILAKENDGGIPRDLKVFDKSEEDPSSRRRRMSGGGRRRGQARRRWGKKK